MRFAFCGGKRHLLFKQVISKCFRCQHLERGNYYKYGNQTPNSNVLPQHRHSVWSRQAAADFFIHFQCRRKQHSGLSFIQTAFRYTTAYIFLAPAVRQTHWLHLTTQERLCATFGYTAYSDKLGGLKQ